MIKFITTNLKFSKHSKSGKLVSFISKVGSSWRGVRESSQLPKLIVLLDSDLARFIEEDVLYKCRLVPMTNKTGYVAVSAFPIRYYADVETEMLPRTFKINIHFGNRTVVYDPNSSDEKYNDPDRIATFLRATNQIRNVEEVISELNRSINIVKRQYA